MVLEAPKRQPSSVGSRILDSGEGAYLYAEPSQAKDSGFTEKRTPHTQNKKPTERKAKRGFVEEQNE